MGKRFYSVISLLFCVTLFHTPVFALEKQVIAGAGPSTKIVQLFAESFSKLPGAKGIEFEVPPKSSKHKGGLVSSNYNLFGRTGRPLNEEEKKLNKEEIILARVPIAIVTGKGTGISKLTLSHLKDIATGSVTNWSKVGGPDKEIIYVGREEKEALFSVLKQDYPFFRESTFKFTFNKDNHLVDYFRYNPDSKFSIGFGALPNFTDVYEVNIVTIDGFESGVSLGLVYDLKNSENPVVQAAIKYANSDEWKAKVTGAGLLPAQ